MYTTPTEIVTSEFASSGDKVSPSEAQIAAGYLPSEQLPAEHFNFYLSMLTKVVRNYGSAFRAVTAELVAILTAAGASPNGSMTTQVKAALDVLYATPLATHAALSNPHNATDAATASRIILRDSAGRAKVADPSVAADIATKGYADAHAALSNPHNAASENTANRLVLRDQYGAAKIGDPSDPYHIANRRFVESKVNEHAGSDIAHNASVTPVGGRIVLRNDNGFIKSLYPQADDDVATKQYADIQDLSHANSTNPHSATDAATASRIILRDSAGRAKVADPSVAADIATKGYADAHAALSNPHNATDAVIASRLILRDSAGRAKVADPSVAADIATKAYIDKCMRKTRFKNTREASITTNVVLRPVYHETMHQFLTVLNTAGANIFGISPCLNKGGTNALNWTIRGIAPANITAPLLYANGVVFVQCGTTLYTTTDCMTFTSRGTYTIWDVIYNGTLYVAQMNGGVYTSADLTTWTLRDSNVSGARIFSYNPNVPSLVFSINDGGGTLYRSNNGGLSWAAITPTGMFPNTAPRTPAIDDDGNVYVAARINSADAYGRILKSTDYGSSFTSTVLSLDFVGAVNGQVSGYILLGKMYYGNHMLFCVPYGGGGGGIIVNDLTDNEHWMIAGQECTPDSTPVCTFVSSLDALLTFIQGNTSLCRILTTML